MARKKILNPVNVQFGWIQIEDRKSARDYVKGVVNDRFMSHETCWYAIYPYLGGFFWEAHESGGGRGYVKSAVEALENDPGGSHWFPVNDRAYMVVMQDGKPFPHLLPSEKSVEIFNSGTQPLSAGFKMTPMVRKGTGWLVAGAAMATMSSVMFIGSVAFYAIAHDPGPSTRAVDFQSLPHMQWKLVQNTKLEEIVGKLELKDGKDWNVSKRPFKIPDLEKLRELRMMIEKENAFNASRAQAETAQKQREFEDSSKQQPPTGDVQQEVNTPPMPPAAPTVATPPIIAPNAPASAGAPPPPTVAQPVKPTAAQPIQQMPPPTSKNQGTPTPNIGGKK